KIMAEITTALIKQLRDKTNAGMMDCKAALQKTDGDLEAAETELRKQGIADADKKAGRSATEGVVASRISDDGKSGVLVEVNCETDFVAKNENFTSFVGEILDHVSASSAANMEELMAEDYAADADISNFEEFIKAKVGQLGENLGLTRFARYSVDGNGGVADYIHMAGKVGVMAAITAKSADTLNSDAFKTFAKDLGMHIAAAQPICLNRDEVPAELVESEKEIFREQMKDKPENIIEKIIGGKLDKFYATNCLLEQAFIKDGDKSINDLIADVNKETGDEIEIAGFDRYALGESAAE
ncbi:MAG: translation elongation factor Ts, partial [Verrucomicrobiota bacterium]